MKKFGSLVVGIACLGLLGACSSKTEMKDTMMSDTSRTMSSSSSEMTSSSMSSGENMETTQTMSSSEQLAPQFTLQGVDGKTYRLSDYKGKKVYIKFWASWCSICLSTLQETDELAKMEADDVVVLSVVAPDYNGEKSEDDFKSWYASLDYKHLPVLLDQGGQIMQEYGVRSFPTAAFISSDGQLAKLQVGFMTAEQVQEELASI